MSDFISRQALCEYALNQKNKSVTPNDIMRFPSAHPKLDEWCTDCKEYDHERHCCPRYNRVIRESLEEISIIRCKDCKHNMKSSKAGNACCDIFYGMTNQYGFCHMGERRTDD